MTRPEFIIILFEFVFISITSLNLGVSLLRFSQTLFQQKAERLSIEMLGTSLLIGLGLIGYLSLAVGLTGNFHKNTLFVLLTVIFIATLANFPHTVKGIFYEIKKIIPALKKDFLTINPHLSGYGGVTLSHGPSASIRIR